jgi:hypothetical protein
VSLAATYTSKLKSAAKGVFTQAIMPTKAILKKIEKFLVNTQCQAVCVSAVPQHSA